MINNASLPIIDISGFRGGNFQQQKIIADHVRHACETAGFFYVSGHGIHKQVFEDAKQVALEFFRKPSAFKSQVHITKVPHHRGYVGNFDVAPDTSKGGDIREAYKVAFDLPANDPDHVAGITLYGPNIWPDDMPQFRDKLTQAYAQFQTLSETIFSLFAIGLDQPADFFKPLIVKPASVMNVNYYPATGSESDSEFSGIGAHSDYEAFAMLWQDGVGGLQIESLEGEWESVQPLEDALVINIGDLMQRWTNDRFRATRHRVINVSGKERVSLACFGNTNYHALIKCIDSCCSAENPVRYPAVKSGDYLMDAIKRTYAYTD